MCQVVRNAMGHLTLDVADAIIGRRRRGRGCHGVTMMATVSLAWSEARMMCDASSERATKNKKRQARYGTGFSVIWDGQTSQKTAQNTGSLALARVDSEKSKSKFNSS